jgi:hypothetical protein
LIGLPVTARIDSAAPPRPSPSTRVSTMPVRARRARRTSAQIDRVLAGERVGDQQHLVRIGGAPDIAASFIMSSSSVMRPAVSSSTTS